MHYDPVAGPAVWHGCEVFATRYGSVAPGSRGGIFLEGSALKVPLEAE